MSIPCKHCGETNTRSIDNQPLFHPKDEKEAKETMSYDNELYMKFICDDCKQTFEKVFVLVPVK